MYSPYEWYESAKNGRTSAVNWMSPWVSGSEPADVRPESPPVGRRCGELLRLLDGVHADEPAACAVVLELDDAGDFREERVVFA